TDVILEPSAGTGNIAVFSKLADPAKVYVNELSERRAELLKTLGFDEVFTEDAEQLDNILPDRIKPTVIVMNPPFSATAGRLKKNATKYGAKHIEQALNRLEAGGRLVAITGKGMADEAPAFKEWWAKIKQKYDVKANIGISGEAYRKYGTTFDNRILVIDKTGKTDYIKVTGKVDSYQELIPMLEGVRNERVHPGKQPTIKQAGEGVTEEGRPVARPAISIRRPTGELQPGKEPDIREEPRPRTVGGEPVVAAPERGGEGVEPEGIRGAERPGEVLRDRTGRAGQFPDRAQPELFVESRKTTKAKTELTDSIYDDYEPKVAVKKSVVHPTRLVQSSAMAARELPESTYTPDLPIEVIKKGQLSDAQLEGIVYAGQAHDQMLDDGNRKGFFDGDGTGVGKGRIIAGIIRDNWNKGRTKSVWISKRADLFQDAKRDMTGSGWEEGAEKLFELPKAAKLGNKVKRFDGTMFVTYGTLRSGANKTAIDKPETFGDLTARINQIVDWLGDDFDGVVAFDESHKMANSIAQRQGRFTSKPSAQAIAGMMLQKRMPQARILYVSATGATEVSNLAYAERLGLWGPGTPFTSKAEFIDKIASGGLNAMEMISGDMKSMGVYIARSLAYTDVSFKGDNVEYRRLEHKLTENQRGRYDKMAEAWQVVLNNMDEALEVTGKVHDRHGVGVILSQFWGSHQRFFNQVITAMQMPSVMDDIQKQIDAGHAVLVQLVNTNEAAQNRAFTKMEEEGQEKDLEDLDMTPRESLMRFLETGFPVNQYEEYEDEEGNTRVRPVFDSEGNPVINKEAERARDQLLMEVGSLKVEGNPLD
ncbi:MAG: strawberry notch-like NTP hydrolase domain-containing protein, partial [Planctomycetota bacterium]